MLNLFPIQFLAPVAYMILRVCVGLIFIYYGRLHIKHRVVLKDALLLPRLPWGGFWVWYLALIEIIVGLLFVFGLYTQIAALLAMIFVLKLFFLRNYFLHPHLPNWMIRVLLFFASLSLFITGAGIFAFDLPI
jgi:uncharacterized membrane protein YphA (DoxX/SURF4 family)